MSSSGRTSVELNESQSSRALRKGLSFFVATCIFATVGYVLAGWEWMDAIYMVTITIFGVGYGEVRPIEGPWMKLFTIGVIFAGWPGARQLRHCDGHNHAIATLPLPSAAR